MTPDQLAQLHSETKDARAVETAAIAAQIASEEAERRRKAEAEALGGNP